MFDLTKKELSILKKLSTPIKIQNFLDEIPLNFEKSGDTHMSPRKVLLKRKAHCIEGALLAATALWLHGEKPLLLDLKANERDDDHVVALYKQNGYWGAMSKTNHATVRFRDPIYKTIRELACSYFHEYFLDSSGEKTLVSFSKPLNMKKFGTKWITEEKDLWHIAEALDKLPHFRFYPPFNKQFIRKADRMERKAGKLREWKPTDWRT